MFIYFFSWENAECWYNMITCYLSRFKPGISSAIRAINAMRYMWSAIDSGPFIPWLIHPFLLVVCVRERTMSILSFKFLTFNDLLKSLSASLLICLFVFLLLDMTLFILEKRKIQQRLYLHTISDHNNGKIWHRLLLTSYNWLNCSTNMIKFFRPQHLHNLVINKEAYSLHWDTYFLTNWKYINNPYSQEAPK